MRLALALLALTAVPAAAQDAPDRFDAETFAAMALSCIHQEYPNKIAHVLQGDADALTPRQLYPAFYGCFDWHSAVHGHWLLARYLHTRPDAPQAEAAAAALAQSLQPAHIATEVAYLTAPGRGSFERPYGLAWLLQLHAELIEMESPHAASLQPLATAARAKLAEWLPKLDYPIRTGEHSQTAFAFGLMLDWAHTAEDTALRDLLAETTRRLYLADRACPLGYEPSGQDFLSPCLAEADLVRRVLDPQAFADWLAGFLPTIGQDNWLPTARVSDRTDGKLAHLDGLNLSRAWMLEGIAAGLPSGDPRVASLQAAADRHRAAGLEGIASGDYAGQHWLGSFALYLTSGRGL